MSTKLTRKIKAIHFKAQKGICQFFNILPKETIINGIVKDHDILRISKLVGSLEGIGKSEEALHPRLREDLLTLC